MERMCGVSQDEPRYWNLFEFDSYGKCGVLEAWLGPVDEMLNATREVWFIGAKTEDQPALIS
jgi:hypothetical protein